MMSALTVVCALLVVGASDEAHSAGRLQVAWNGPNAGMELDPQAGQRVRSRLGVGVGGPEGLGPDALRAAPWIGPTLAAQLMMHESAHALVPFLRGDETVRVRFFPDVRAGRFGQATWSREGPAAYDMLASGMPKLLDLAVITTAGLAKRTARARWSRGLLSAVQIVALGDFLQGTLTIWRPPGRWNDAWYLTQRLDEGGVHLGKGGARVAMTTLAAAGVALCAATW